MSPRRWTAVRLLALVALVIGCATAGSGPRPIRIGARCDACGMEITDLRFACERVTGGAWRFYDAIECLLRDQTAGGAIWLADYDSATLHASDSMWVVHGNLPSPMGGGYAAFLDRAAADEVADRTGGRVARPAEYAARESAP